MPVRHLNPTNLATDEDWVGNNAVFTCPLCNKVFLVSNGMVGPNPLPGHHAQGVRHCPGCGNSTASITGGAAQHPNTTASIQW